MCAPTLGFPRHDEGATAAEYAILLALIIAAAITSIRVVGDASTGVWATDVGRIQKATQGR